MEDPWWNPGGTKGDSLGNVGDPWFMWYERVGKDF